ncbi:MAG: Ku protein [Anaerocolumna sp.]|nr:Ku protein [Anaerocolumna sp.]
MLDKESKARIRYKKYCSHCNKEVTAKDIIKGYEYEKDKYVIMTEEELEKIKTKKDKTIHIIQFAKLSEVDQLYYEKNYYGIPDTGAEKAFELLRQSLLTQKKVAIAKTVIGTRENLLVLYPTKDGLIVKTLFYQDEVVAPPKQVPKVKLEESELEMAKMLIDTMTKPFDATTFKDEYQERLREAIMTKIQGKEIITADAEPGNNVIDLMEALQKSLDLSKFDKLSGTA